MTGAMLALLLMTSGAAAAPADKEVDRFLDECRYILTSLEVKMFKSLDGVDRKREFIDNFWKGIDPNPATAYNEYKELYYRRIDEANRLYSHGTPGYLTDRGKIYILMGTPDEKETNYSGRTSSERPSEIWIYRSAKHRGLDRDAELTFVADGSGIYRLSSRKALEGGEARATSVAIVKGDLVALGVMAEAQTNPRDLGNSPTLVAENDAPAPPGPGEAPAMAPAAPVELKLDVKARYDFFKADLGKTLVVMTVSLDRAKATGGAADYKSFAKLAPKVDDPLDPPVDLIDSFESRETTAELLYQVQVPASPGERRMLWGVTDVALGASKSFEDPITVPDLSGTALTLSSVVPATSIDKAPEHAPAAAPAAPVAEGEAAPAPVMDEGPKLYPFELSASTVIPAINAQYGKKDELFLYYQVYGAGTDASGQHKLDIKYLISKKQKDGKWKPIGQLPQPDQTQMAQIYQLPISDIPTGAGEYKVDVTVKDTVGNQAAKGEAFFIVK